MANSTQTPAISTSSTQNEVTSYAPSFQNFHILQSLSPERVQKMKYKIELDKQVFEKQQRLAHEWEGNIEREKTHVQHQPFGRHHQTTIFKREELEEILSKSRAPLAMLDMPSQYAIHHQSQSAETYIPKDEISSNMTTSLRQSSYDSHPQYSTTQPQLSKNTNFDFQRFYEPNNNTNPNGSVTSTLQPMKGEAHDPFSSYDPNKDGQQTFNSIPQQDLYDPWGRPGAGAPLIHASTGKKFTRYSGSLQDKVNRNGSFGFRQNQYIYNIDEQKRRQEEETELRSNKVPAAGMRYRSEASRVLHDDLVRQAEERARMNKMSRFENNLAEKQHSQAMNNWWGRGGNGASSFINRRYNVDNSFENPRRTWGTNHLGQLVLTDKEQQNDIRVQTADFSHPTYKQFSSHRNFYEITDNQTS